MSFSWFENIYNATKEFYEIIMGDDSSKLTGWIKSRNWRHLSKALYSMKRQ